jgi:hypothetical protein
MKIAITICDPWAYSAYGGEIERKTCLVELQEDQLPEIFKQYIQQQGAKSISFALLHEEAKEAGE